MSGEILKICSEITELYKFGTVEEKQKLINYTLQNFLVEGETLHYEYKTPFNFFALGLNRNKKLPRLNRLAHSRLTAIPCFACRFSIFGKNTPASARSRSNQKGFAFVK